jgi:transposase
MISDNIKACIVRSRDEGLSYPTISRIFEVSADAARKLVDKERLIAEVGPKPTIRKSRFSGQVKRELGKIIAENPNIAATKIPRLLQEALPEGTAIPKRTTCQQMIKELGFERRKAKRKQFISSVNQQKRLEFAREYLAKEDWSWDLVIWSDETMVRKCSQGKEIYFWCHKDRETPPEFYNGQMQNGGFGVMFWGCFSRLGVGPLVVVEGSMNSQTYIEIIRDYLLDEIKAAKESFGVDMIFMQDNAPAHKSNAVTRFFQQRNIQTLPWPPQSPDLNPIENLWAIIKQRRATKFGVPRTRNDLIDQVLEIWDSIEPELIEVLADSAPRRLTKCLANNGLHSGY